MAFDRSQPYGMIADTAPQLVVQLGVIYNTATGATVTDIGPYVTTSRGIAVGASVAPESYGAVGNGTTDDTAAIQTAINALSNIGGGAVQLSDKTYYIPSGLQMKNGVYIVGPGATTSLDNNYTRTKGCWLLGNGTNPGVYANNTPLAPGASQPSFNTILATALRNVGVIGVGFDNFTRGIYIGELGSPGILEGGRFQDIISRGCTQWNIYFENYIWCRIDNVRTFALQANAIGDQAYWVSTTNYNFGNGLHTQILAGTGYGNGTVSNLRGLSFVARAGARHNHINASCLQCTSADAAIAISATTNATTYIALTRGQGVNCPLDMPVIFSTSNTTPTAANGWDTFAGLQTYFVVPPLLTANLAAGATSFTLASAFNGVTGSYSVKFSDGSSQTLTLTHGSAGPYTITALANAVWGYVQIFGTVAGSTSDYIQVANMARGAALTCNSSATNYLIRYGFPLLEVDGYDYHTDPYNTLVTTTSLVQSATLSGLDMEGFATCLIFLQNGNFTVPGINYLGGSGNQGVAYASRLCTRGLGNNNLSGLSGNAGLSIDADASPVASGIGLNVTGQDPTRIIQKFPWGINVDLQQGAAVLNIRGDSNTRGSLTPHIGQSSGGSQTNWHYAESPIGQYLQAYTGAGFAIAGAEAAGCVSLTNAGATTYTLPNLDSTTPGTQPYTYSWIGCPFEFANCNQPGGTNMTIKTNNVNQCFNQQNTGNASTATNTCTLAPGQSISLIAHYDIRTAVAFWFVRGNNGGTFSHT